MSAASWQEELRLRLNERNRKESAYAGVIEQYRRLAQQTRLLKERNQALLRAVGSGGKGSGNGLSSSTTSTGGGNDSGPSEYISSLLSEISSLRDEVSTVYRTQSQNAQRLLSMTETLRDKEEMLRIEGEQLRKAREELGNLKRKVEQHGEIMGSKDNDIQILHDDLQALNLELTQLTLQNKALKSDNASLLQRWIDHQNDAVQRMNSANTFYEEMRSKGWGTGQVGEGKGQGRRRRGSMGSSVSGASERTPSQASGDDRDEPSAGDATGEDPFRGVGAENPNG